MPVPRDSGGARKRVRRKTPPPPKPRKVKRTPTLDDRRGQVRAPGRQPTLEQRRAQVRRPARVKPKAKDRDGILGALDDVVNAAEGAARAVYGDSTPKGKGKARVAAADSPYVRPRPLLPVRIGVNTGRAFAEEPKGTSKATAKGAKDAILGLPGAAVKAVTDPVGTVKDTAKDYDRRYSGTDQEMVDRIKKEGAFAELADATVVLSGGGAVAGRALTSTAKTGALGAKRKAVVTQPRRKLTKGVGPARDQPRSPTYLRAAREKRRDEAAFRGQQRVIARADAEQAKKGVPAKKGAVRAEIREATAAGDILPSRRVGVRRSTTSPLRVEIARVPSNRKINKAQARVYATKKGRALHSQRREQAVEVGGAKRNLSSLDRHEAKAFKDALQLGATTPRAARRLVAARIALIERERADGADERVLDTDELPTLRKLLAEPDKAFTEKLRTVVREERARGERVAAGDPGVATQQAALRRTAPQAEVLGTQRQGTPIKVAQQAARQTTKQAKRARAAAGRRVEVRERQAAREHGRAEVLARQATGDGRQKAKLLDQQAAALDDQAARLHKTARKNMMGARATNPLADIGPLTKAQRRYRHKAKRTGVQKQGVKIGSQSYRTGQRQERRATELTKRAATLRAEAALLRDAKPGDSTQPRPTLRRLERSQASLLGARLARDRAGETVKTAKKTQATLKAEANRGRKLVDAEPIPDYIARTAASRGDAEAPGYFPSRKRETIRFSPFAVGGAKAVQTDKRYTGKLFREGREDASQTTYLQGIAQNIKRKYNWNLVAETFDEGTLAWSRDKTINQLEDEMVRRGVDPSSVAFWNPGRYRQTRQEFDDQSAEIDPAFAGEEPVAAGVGTAVDNATAPDLATMPSDFRATGGWSLIPKALFDEIHADTRPSGLLGRGMDIVKGKQARVMLALSPAWLQFQVVSNGLLAGLSGTGPLDLLKANLVWWKGLDDKQKAAVEPYVGIGAFADSYEQTRLGAASNSALVNSYRAFKAHEFWHKPRLAGKSIRDLNPMDILFRIDNAQNNAFRRGVLYSQVKRDAYKRMGGRIRAVQEAQDGVAGILKLGPKEMMDRIIDEPRALERHAQHVNEFLGDYMTYTAKERRLLQRNVMFYGFLRHSLHLTFYTMPVKHPVMTAIIAQLGRMQTEEVRKLLGGDELPWAMGKVYFTRNGQLKSIDLARANPALNSLTQLRTPSQLVGMAPPLFAAIADQLYSKTSFKDKPFKVQGETQGRPGAEIPLGDRGRIFIEQMLGLAAPYRALKKATSPGPEGDDSSVLLGRRPTKYVREDIVSGIARDQARRPDTLAERLMLEFLPFIPKADYGPEAAASIRERKRGKVVKIKPEDDQLRDALGGGGDPELDQLRDVLNSGSDPELDQLREALK